MNPIDSGSSDRPRLSVSIVTYQQEDYVAEALNSVLAQKTRFPFEIIIGDDASTDSTQAVLRATAARSDRPIRLLFAEKNYGDQGLSNYLATIDACRGDYIALLDGDDCWTSPEKLQWQVDFLDAHPECALCAHRVVHLSDDGQRQLSPAPPGGSGVHSMETLMQQNFAPKISTVFRRAALQSVPGWYRHNRVASADWLFNLLVARESSIGFLNSVLAMHRKRALSLTARYGMERTLEDRLRILEMIEQNFPEHRAAVLRSRRWVRSKQWLLQLGPGCYSTVQRWYGSSPPGK